MSDEITCMVYIEVGVILTGSHCRYPNNCLDECDIEKEDFKTVMQY